MFVHMNLITESMADLTFHLIWLLSISKVTPMLDLLYESNQPLMVW